MNKFCGVVYADKNGKTNVLAAIALARKPDLHEYRKILDQFAEHYAIERENLTISVCDMVPDPRLYGITARDGLLWDGKRMIDCMEGDRLAVIAGFVYAEELVKHLSTS